MLSLIKSLSPLKRSKHKPKNEKAVYIRNLIRQQFDIVPHGTLTDLSVWMETDKTSKDHC